MSHETQGVKLPQNHRLQVTELGAGTVRERGLVSLVLI